MKSEAKNSENNILRTYPTKKWYLAYVKIFYPIIRRQSTNFKKTEQKNLKSNKFDQTLSREDIQI